MVKIEITDIHEYSSILANDIKKKHIGWRALIYILIPLGCGIIFLTMGLMEPENNGLEEPMVRIYAVQLGLGIGLILTGIFRFLDVNKVKKTVTTQLHLHFAKLKRKESTLEFTLTEDNFQSYSALGESRLNWAYFSMFKTENDLLKLFTESDSSSYPTILIPLKYFSESELERVDKLLKKKLKWV